MLMRPPSLCLGPVSGVCGDNNYTVARLSMKNIENTFRKLTAVSCGNSAKLIISKHQLSGKLLLYHHESRVEQNVVITVITAEAAHC